MAFVYVLKSEPRGYYYIGSTQDVSKRLAQHNAGKHHSSKRLGPFKLVFQQEYDNLSMARKIEYRLKKFKRRDFIEKIIKDGQIKIIDD